MVNLSTVAAALSVLTSARSLSQSSDVQEQVDNHTHDTAGFEESDSDGPDVAQKLDTLIDIEQKNQPSSGDKDAFSSATIDLSPGQTAQVTVEPAQGFNLRVKKIHFDRKTDHSYSLNVGGDVTSVSHRAKYVSPKLVTQSDRVVASITNNSGANTTVDFELEAWAERP